MTPPRLLALLLFLCLVQSYCSAQDKSKVVLAKVGPEDFVLPASPIIDSNANAVILSDKGDIHFVGNKKDWFSHVFRKQTRIKILNKKAFGLATVKIRLWTNNDDAEKADNIIASTFNLEDGKVVETKLDPKEVFLDRQDKNHMEMKFTLPAVKEGSIIEYTYTITSDYNLTLPAWEFQSENYPCLWSEYNVIIPQVMFYVLVRQGVHEYCIDKSRIGHESYRVTAPPDHAQMELEGKDLFVNANTVIHQWAMKDIPAFHDEPYLSTPANYLDKLEFQLEKTYNGEDTRDVMNTWSKATEEMLHREDFGAPLQEDNDWLNDILDKVTANSADQLSQAKAIYYYVNGHFTCTNSYWPDIKTTLQDVVKKNSGTVGDLNLLLIAMLRKRSITADPVLLSTREHGFNLAKYPIMDRLNYVIVRVKIGGKIYYLDAAHSQLGFGQLAGNCYNGHARIISQKDSGSVWFEADSLNEKKTTLVMIMNGEKGGLEGSYQSTLGQQESYNTRERVSQIGEKSFFKNIQTSYGEDLEISNTGLDSLKNLEDPVTVHYEFRLKQAQSSLIYFNPLFAEALRENPFKEAERKYPVEMPYVRDNLYIFSMQIPEGYVVDELPKSARVAFNGDQGMFEYLAERQGDMIQLRCHLKLNHAYFAAEDYSALRDFFAYIVKKESEQIVLKKQS